MSYTNETTHYAIPKPLGTDLTVPMDYNDAADAVDQALFDATTNASEAVTAAANAVEAAAGAVSDVGTLGTEVNSLKGRTSALETSDVIQNNKIDALENQGVTKFDSAGIADPYVNGLTYSVGDVVTYNGQRYKCTTAVVAAEPFDADKWSAEDVETVLDELKSDLANTGFKVIRTVTADGVKTWATLLGELGYPTGAKECIETVYNNGATIFEPSQLVDASGHHYVNTVHDTNQFKITELVVGGATARYSFVGTSGGNTITDTSSAVPPSGMTISFVR